MMEVVVESKVSDGQVLKRNQGSIRIKFPKEEHANMVMLSLQVDDELQPLKIEREFQVDKNYLVM